MTDCVCVCVLTGPQSIVIGGAVFVAAWNSHDVLRYETRSDQWSVLPSCPAMWFGLGQLSGKLVTVGGLDGRGYYCNSTKYFRLVYYIS